jgi:hypothetical protein
MKPSEHVVRKCLDCPFCYNGTCLHLAGNRVGGITFHLSEKQSDDHCVLFNFLAIISAAVPGPETRRSPHPAGR